MDRNSSKCILKRMLSAIMGSVVMSSATLSAMPLTAMAEQNVGVIDDTDGKFFAIEATDDTSEEWDGTAATCFAGGTGSVSNPYLIETAEQLAMLTQMLQSEEHYQRYSGSNYRLIKDIVLNSDLTDLTDANEWTPIGAGIFYEEENAIFPIPFSGTFDGGGHTVSGLYISKDADEEKLGLFGECDYAEIMNLTVEGLIDGYDYQCVGGICGYADNTTFKNCVNNAEVRGGSYVGGICGWSNDIRESEEACFTGCTNKGTVLGATAVGGICGWTSADTITISSCTNSGTVGNKPQSSMSGFGGIVGLASGSITDCINKGTVYGYSDVGGIIGKNWEIFFAERCANLGAVRNPKGQSAFDVGGICGSLSLSYSNISEIPIATIRDSYNAGDLTNATGGSVIYLGGIIGSTGGDGNVSIYDCYNKSNIITQASSVGGICGYMSGNSPVQNYITSCYNIGDIHAYYDSNGDKTSGGICGQMEAGIIADCFNMGEIKSTYWSSGLVGMIMDSENGYCQINDCYSAGKCANDYYPLVQGDMMEGTFSNLYFNKDVCPVADVQYFGYAPTQTGKTTAELTSSTVIGDLGFNSKNCLWIKPTNDENYLYYPDIDTIADSYVPFAVLKIPTPVVTVQERGNGKVVISWDEILGATRYAVYLYENGTGECIDTMVTDTTFTMTGLTNGVIYGFKVKAYAGGKWSAASDIVYGVPFSNEAPVNVKAQPGNRQVTLTWDKVLGATRYAVYLYYDGNYRCIDSQIKTNSYKVTDLANDQKYGFKVKAYCGIWSAASTIVYAIPVDPVPRNVSVKAGNEQATITWDKVTGAQRYAVYLYENGYYSCLDSTIKTTSYLAANLTNGVKVGFKVKALVNGKWSEASEMKYVYPIADPVPKISGITAGNECATVAWNKVVGAQRYAVYIYRDGAYKCLSSRITDTSYTATELKNGVKVGFRVKAYINGAWSGASSMSYITPTDGNIIPQNVESYAGDGNVSLTWDDVLGAERYAVYVYADGKYTCVNSNIKDSFYTVQGLTNGVIYGFKVKAYINGAWSGASSMAYAMPEALTE